MPSSRSAKEICQQYGNDSMDCRVARSVEKDTGPPPPKPIVPPAATAPENPVTKRRKYLEDKIAEQGG
jgi:hypothetical protein